MRARRQTSLSNCIKFHLLVWRLSFKGQVAVAGFGVHLDITVGCLPYAVILNVRVEVQTFYLLGIDDKAVSYPHYIVVHDLCIAHSVFLKNTASCMSEFCISCMADCKEGPSWS